MYPESLPQNISLNVLDVKQPIPEDLNGVYDLVHARMLVAAILPTEWTAVARNLTKLLKPGGWLQWGECNFISSKFLRGGPLASSPTDTVVALSDKWREEMRDRFQCGWSTLPGDMRPMRVLSSSSLFMHQCINLKRRFLHDARSNQASDFLHILINHVFFELLTLSLRVLITYASSY